MISRSNPALNQSSRQFKKAEEKTVKAKDKIVNEKGDADTSCPESFQIRKNVLPVPMPQINVRRQQSAPSLSNETTVKPKPDSLNSPKTKVSGKILRPLSASPLISKNSTTATAAITTANASATPSNSNISVTSITSVEPVCEAIEKDPKLKALCISLGINQSPNTLVGPIEKGQLIIGTLQDSLHDLIKMKIKNAERKGEKFHIQQSSLESAVRALRNAERSLKTIKESKQPVLGRARHQRSAESLLQCHKKTTNAVIRILTGTKEKFDKTESGINKFLYGISLVSALSSSTTPSSSTGVSGYTTRRTTGTSLATTPVTPAHSIATAACSRARTATSLTSVGGSSTTTRGKSIHTM